MERKCSKCALKELKNGMCPVFNANMDGEKGCPYFTTTLSACEICGSIIPKGGVLQEENDIFHLLCESCATGSPCKRCVKNSECKLEQDSSCPEPLYITVQHRQGNAIVQTQQLNPKRIEATCAKGCACFYPEGMKDGYFCFKQIGCGCNNIINNWRKQ